MNQKRELYEGFHERMSAASKSGFHLEASWYCYAMIEDRLSSLLKNTGGIGRNGSARPIRMLGKKLEELNNRATSDELLKSCLPSQEVHDWKENRNSLMHAMADGSLSLSEIEKQAYLLTLSGEKLIKNLSAAAMRLKKHRSKVASP